MYSGFSKLSDTKNRIFDENLEIRNHDSTKYNIIFYLKHLLSPFYVKIKQILITELYRV